MTTLTWLTLTLLADDTPRNTGPDFGKASPFGLLVVVLLLIGTFGLVWSMNRHLRKLPQSFDRDRPESDQSEPGDTAETTTDPSSPNQERGGQPTG